ncbi:MAG: hypothetical protein ACU0BE_08155, partial [Paracoccus sp. (in: a-proteobacteria)]
MVALASFAEWSIAGMKEHHVFVNFRLCRFRFTCTFARKIIRFQQPSVRFILRLEILQSWTFVLYFRRLWVVPGSMQSCRQGARHAVNEKNMCFSDGEVQLKYWKEAAVGAFMAVAASGASAATCGPATGDTKTVTVTSGSATVECYAYGSGNINGNVKQDPILNGQTTGKNTFTLVSGPVITGLTFLDNTSESGGAKDGGVTSNGSSTVGQSVVGKVTVGDVSPYSGLILALKI